MLRSSRLDTPLHGEPISASSVTSWVTWAKALNLSGLLASLGILYFSGGWSQRLGVDGKVWEVCVRAGCPLTKGRARGLEQRQTHSQRFPFNSTYGTWVCKRCSASHTALEAGHCYPCFPGEPLRGKKCVWGHTGTE